MMRRVAGFVRAVAAVILAVAGFLLAAGEIGRFADETDPFRRGE